MQSEECPLITVTVTVQQESFAGVGRGMAPTAIIRGKRGYSGQEKRKNQDLGTVLCLSALKAGSPR